MNFSAFFFDDFVFFFIFAKEIALFENKGGEGYDITCVLSSNT